MTTNTLSAGNALAPAALVGGNDGTLNIIVGPAGSPVTALSIDAAGNATFAGKGGLQLGTAQATTSGTSFDFSAIPSWAQRITVILNGISTNGTSPIFIRIGSAAGGIETTGYAGSAVYCGPGTAGAVFTAGFAITASVTSTDIYAGSMVLTKVSGTTWVASSTCGSVSGAAYAFLGGGNKTTAGVLDRVRLTTANGTDIFDLGSANILIEG